MAYSENVLITTFMWNLKSHTHRNRVSKWLPSLGVGEKGLVKGVQTFTFMMNEVRGSNV